MNTDTYMHLCPQNDGSVHQKLKWKNKIGKKYHHHREKKKIPEEIKWNFRFDYKALNLAAIVNHYAKQGINDLYERIHSIERHKRVERQRQKTTTVTLLREDEEKQQPCLILTRHKLLLLISIAWVHEHIISNIVINKAALMQFRICIVMRNIFTFKWNLSHRIHCLRWRRWRWLLLYLKLIDFINRYFVSASTKVPYSFSVANDLLYNIISVDWLIFSRIDMRFPISQVNFSNARYV